MKPYLIIEEKLEPFFLIKEPHSVLVRTIGEMLKRKETVEYGNFCEATIDIVKLCKREGKSLVNIRGLSDVGCVDTTLCGRLIFDEYVVGVNISPRKLGLHEFLDSGCGTVHLTSIKLTDLTGDTFKDVIEAYFPIGGLVLDSDNDFRIEIPIARTEV